MSSPDSRGRPTLKAYRLRLVTRSLPVPKGATLRELPIHPQLRTDLQLWLDERPDWSHAQTNPANPALLLNRRGGRLTTRGASDIFHTIATNAGLDDTVTAHIGRHTFVTTLVRGGTDLVLVADMLGHARLDIVHLCAHPASPTRTSSQPPAI